MSSPRYKDTDSGFCVAPAMTETGAPTAFKYFQRRDHGFLVSLPEKVGAKHEELPLPYDRIMASYRASHVVCLLLFVFNVATSGLFFDF